MCASGCKCLLAFMHVCVHDVCNYTILFVHYYVIALFFLNHHSVILWLDFCAATATAERPRTPVTPDANRLRRWVVLFCFVCIHIFDNRPHGQFSHRETKGV